MARIDCNLNLYKTPSNEVLRKRKEFYGLWKKNVDQTTEWLNQVQSQINRCEFPTLISREYLLIDKCLCELDDSEREFIQSVNTWTLTELNEYFVHRKKETDSTTADTNNQVNETVHLNPLPVAVVKCEFVSNSQNCTHFFPSFQFPINCVIFLGRLRVFAEYYKY